MLKNVFLLDTNHDAFVKGNRKHLTSHTVRGFLNTVFPLFIYCVCPLGIGVNALVQAFNQALDRSYGTFPGAIFFLGVGAFLTFNQVRRYVKQRKLVREGRLIEGELLSLSCLWEPEDNDLRISLQYRYYRSDGIPVEREMKDLLRNDLKDKVLPEPGAKLAILYVNDDLFMVL